MRSILALTLLAAAAIAAQPVVDIKVDQAGYLPGHAKVALLAAATDAREFTVQRASDGKTVFRGKLAAAQTDTDSGDKVQAADFTKFNKSGRYYLNVAGVGRSWEFAIGADAFVRPYYLATRSFYGQRCGTAVDLGPEFPGFKHDACHPVGAWHESSGKTGDHVSAKGWHDAGDYGRYIVNSGLTTGTMLWAYELFGARVSKVQLNIPESGNGTPDLLNELRWNLEWMLSMQDSDGGVFHKQTSARFCGFVMPEKDDLPSVVIGTGKDPFKGTCATADFAAVMAIAARVYKPFDSAFAEQCAKAARAAWNWAEAHPTVLFNNPAGVSTGAYGDRNCADEMLWAAAELWRATGESAFEAYFLAHWAEMRPTLRAVGPMSWANVAPMGLWAYALGKGLNAETVAAIREDSIKAADDIAARTAAHGYRQSLTAKDFIWGSNGVAANYGVQLLVANQMKANPAYVSAALDNLHYLLGRNPFSLSYVTAVGANAYQHPHHRPSGADTNAAPWPGLLSGGPNRARQDPAMKKMENRPPMRMFLDDQESYASNEVAINWNAPLVFLLAGVLP